MLSWLAQHSAWRGQLSFLTAHEKPNRLPAGKRNLGLFVSDPFLTIIDQRSYFSILAQATHFVHLDRAEKGRATLVNAVLDFLAK
jgi:hypothetical protein